MNKKRYPFTQNREISWLKFNQRVLEEAADPSVELLERLKFLAIFTSNLDEFFMVRAGSLMDMALVDNAQIDAKSGMTPSEQLDAICQEARRLYGMRDNIYKKLTRTLKEIHIEIMNWKDLDKKQVRQVSKFFEKDIRPLLAPQIIDIHHPFPFLINKENYIFFQIVENGKSRYGIVPLPSYLPEIFYLNEEKTQFILTEKVVFHNLDKLFSKAKIPFKTIIRVTRNADINLNVQDIDDDEDYRQYMKKILKRRSRLSPIRLEIYKYINPAAQRYLCRQLGLSEEQVFVSKRTPLSTGFFFDVISSLPANMQSALSYKPFVPQTSSRLNPDAPLIPQILDHDVLLFYPYQDIGLFVNLLREASMDENVLSIRITIYRLAKNSKIVRYLCRAAENGKDVMVLMELRARFDEQNNIRAAEQLEEAGCTVIYGFDDYKVHSKLMQITLKTRNGIRTITQVGTGNYNEKTSRQYTDFSFITSRSDIGQDAAEFFRNMNISNLSAVYNKLIVSPNTLKKTVMEKLDLLIEQAKQGKKAKAWFKMNSLTDLDLIAKLSEASNAGVKIRMIIRGICCLLPGLPGFTENIEIHSIVGRFLEHGRLYIFEWENHCDVYISSADFMTRNTERRVEVGCPIEDPVLKNQLIAYFDEEFNDNRKGRVLMPTGYYRPVDNGNEEPNDSQAWFIDEARREAWVAPKEPEKPAWNARLASFFSSLRKPKS